MPRHDVEHLFAVFDAASGGQLVPEEHLGAGIVRLWRELKAAALLVALECPPGERARGVDHIELGIAAVHAKRVQFE